MKCPNSGIPVLVALLALAGCGDDSASGEHQQHEQEQAQQASGEQHSGDQHEKHEKESGGRHIRLTPEQRATLDLNLVPVRSGRADEVVVVPATTRFHQDHISHVGPLLSGRVRKVLVDLGQAVKAGDPLAVLTSPELGDARARFLRIQADREAARADYQRQQRLAKQDIASEAELLAARARFRGTRADLRTARASLRAMGMSTDDIDQLEQSDDLTRYVLTSPQAGVVEKRDLAPGERVQDHESPLLIARSDSLWILGQAPEKHASVVATGQAVQFRSKREGASVLEGRLDWVAQHLDKKARTLRVRAVVNNDAGVKANQFGQLKIMREVKDGVAMVPVDAVQRLNGKPHVFVPGDKDGVFRAVVVQTGAEGHGLIEVTSGLNAGTEVVARGAFDLKSALTASGRSAEHSH